MSEDTEDVAFVGGATGYTGREVVRALRQRGVTTVAHVRPGSSERETWRERFESLGAKVDNTPWEPSPLAATFARWRPSLVFALLGTTRSRGAKDGGSYDTVDYGLTAMLMAAAASVEPRPRFVYLSSAGVPVDEPSPQSYMHARWQIEHELDASDLPYLAARPSIITGADRDESRPAERLGAGALDGALAVAGALGLKSLRARYRSTTNEILGEALVRIALDRSLERCVVESESLR